MAYETLPATLSALAARGGSRASQDAVIGAAGKARGRRNIGHISSSEQRGQRLRGRCHGSWDFHHGLLVLAAVAAVAPGCLYDPELPGSNADSSGGDEDSSSGDEDSSGGRDESGGDESSGGDEGPAPSPEPDPMPEPDPAPDPGPEPDPEPDCEPSDEICNGFDDDCDGEIDEPCPADGAAIVLANDLLGVQYALGATEYPGTPSMLETQLDGNMVLVSPQQVWTVHHLGDGWMRLVNEALGEAYSLDSSPVEPVIGPTGDYTGQGWTVTEDDSGCIRLFNLYLGPAQSLATDSDTFDLLMAETGPSAGQCWQLVPLQ